ncbi:MAG TPA: alpha/beta fold hydrolase [Candidatus Limnocylindrales bacterium]|nr:alpha/beta fold hydrolase [Candidatus Limnocylindrales bacterium]
MRVALRGALLAAILCGATICARAQGTKAAGSAAEGAQQFAELGDLKLQSGGVIHDFRLGYRTLGKLNAEKSNAVIWPTWLGGKSEDILQFVGPGKVVDNGKYFVVLVDAIGNGVSTSPSNSKLQPRMKFPQFMIRDMVEAERRLAMEVLHLSHLRAVMGVSMGGMQTFEWAVAYPDFTDLAIAMAGSPQSTSYDKLQWTAMIDAVELDPAWNNGNPSGSMKRGLEMAAEIATMNLTSPEYRVQETPTEQFDAFLAETRKDVQGDGGTAWDYIRQRQAIMALDIPGEYGTSMEQAAKRVRAKMLVVVSPQDHHVNPIPAVKFAQAIGAPVINLDSPCGHLAFTCISMGPTVAQFLADPGSVRSATIHDPNAR